MLDAVTMPAAIVSLQGKVLKVNERWQTNGEGCLGLDDKLVEGSNYVELLRTLTGPNQETAQFLADRIGELARGEITDLDEHLTGLTGEPPQRKWKHIRGRTLTYDGERLLLLMKEDTTRAHHMEEALRQSESRYRSVVEDQQEMICRFLPDTTLTFVNGAYCRYFELQPEDLIGRKFVELIPENEHCSVYDGLKALTPDQPWATYRHQVIDPRGDAVWQEWTNRAVFGDDGSPTEFQAVGRDITSLVEAQQALRDSEQRFREIVEGGLDAIIVYEPCRDKDGRIEDMIIVDMNSGIVDMLNIAREQLLGQRLLTVFPHVTQSGFLARAIEVIETGRGIDIEVEITPDHPGWGLVEARWQRQQYVPVGDGIAVLIRDISESKRAEQIIIQQRQETQTILDSVPAFIFYKDSNNRILRVNRAVSDAAGLPVDQIEGRHTAEVYPDDADAYYQDDLKVIRSGQPKLNYVEPLTNPDGQMRWVRTDKVPVFNDDHEVTGIIVIASDVTALKQANEQLALSEQRYRSLFYRVPVAVWVEDCTAMASRLNLLRSQGVADLADYLAHETKVKSELLALTSVRRVNQACHDLYHTVSRDDFLQAVKAERLPGVDEMLEQKLKAIWDGTLSVEFEMETQWRFARPRDFHCRYEIAQGDDGLPDYSQVIVVVLELTEQRLRQFDLARAEQAERERRRLGHELHDTLGQQLTGLNMLAEGLRRRMEAKALPEAERVAELAGLVAEANSEVRRLIRGATPEPVSAEGLESALQNLAESLSAVHEMPVDFHCPTMVRVGSDEVATQLLFIAREAAHNAAKHARASRVDIRLEQVDGFLTLSVEDDGVGIAATQGITTIAEAGRDAQEKGYGREIMDYRARSIGGSLMIDSAKGGGTRVCCALDFPDALENS